MEIFPVALGKYDHHEDLDVEAEVAKIVAILADFGGHQVPWLAAMADRGADAVNARLRSWSRPTEPANSIFYWVGHGWNRGRKVALAHARTPASMTTAGISPEAFAEALLDRLAAAAGSWTAVIIDACWSSRFVDRVGAVLSDHEEAANDVLLIGTSGSGATNLGRFTSALSACLNEDFAAVDAIALWDLGRELQNRMPEALVIPRRIHAGKLVRRASPVAATLPGPLDVVRDLEQVVARLSPDARRHFLIKAQGAEEGEISWFFEGREQERRTIVERLRSDHGGMVVVTGAAGSGKSALLGHLLVHSLPDLRGALAEGGLVQELPKDALPPDNVFNEVIHLTGIGLGELIARISEAAGLGTLPSRSSARFDTAYDIDWLIRGLGMRSTGLTLLMDALDEAVDPLGIVRALLRRLAQVPGLCIVLGTRASTRESPDHPDRGDRNLLDALGAGFPGDTCLLVPVRRDAEAVVRYVRRRLQTARNRGKLVSDGRPVPDVAIERAADLIAKCRHEFLFARLTVYEVLAEPSLLDSTRSASLRHLLSGDHQDVFAAAVSRLSRRSDTLRPLMEALALARGRGIPIVDGVWARMANALALAAHFDVPPITPTDVSALLAVAQPYVAIDANAGQTVYRLAHRTFVEHFERAWARRSERGTRSMLEDRQRRVSASLTEAAREAPSGRVNPYIRRHLSGHVADADSWALLDQSVGVLDRLDPDAVLADAQRTVIGRGRVLPAIAGVVGARHRLSASSVADRAGLRQLATYRHSSQRVSRDVTSPESPWAVAAADAGQFPLHVVLEGHTGYVRSMCSIEGPDRNAEGNLLVSAGDDGFIRIWNPTTGTPVGAPLIGHDGRVETVCRVADVTGSVIASGGTDGTIRFWEPVTGTAVGTPLRGHHGAVEGICAVFIGERTMVASAGADGRVRIWDTAGFAESSPSLMGHNGPARAVCPVELGDGTPLLASAGVDGTVRLWDLGTRSAVGDPIRGHLGGVTGVCTVRTPEGILLASAGVDGTIRIWDPLTGTALGPPLSARSGGVAGLCALESRTGGCYLAAAIVNGTVQFWDPVNSRAVGPPLSGHTGPVRGVCSLPMPGERTLLASAGADGTVRIWDPATATAVKRRLSSYTRPSRGVCAVELRDGRQILASSEADGTVRRWSARTATPVGRPLGGHAGPVWGVCQVRDRDGGALLASSGADGVIRLWDPETGRQRGEGLVGHVGTVAGLCSVPVPFGGELIASAGGDGTVRLWDPWRERAAGPPMTGHTGTVWKVCAVTDANGRVLVASAGSDGEVRRWDPVTFTPVGGPILGHAGTVRGGVCEIRLQSGESILVSAGNDGTVRLWDPTTGAPTGPPITGHTGTVVGICGIPWADGRMLIASAGVDGTIRLWDPVTREQVGRAMRGNSGGHWGICSFPLDGRNLLGLSGNDGSVQLWDPVTGMPIGPPLSGAPDAVHHVALGFPPRPTSLCVLTGGDNRIRRWSFVTAKSVEWHSEHRGTITALTVLHQSHGGSVVVTGDVDGTIRSTDMATGRPTNAPLDLGDTEPILAMCGLPGHPTCVVVAHGSAVKVCDLVDRSVVATLRGEVPEYPRALAVIGDAQGTLVCAGQDGTIQSWSVGAWSATGSSIAAHDGWVWALCDLRSALPGHVASAGADGVIRTWDMQRRKLREPLRGHTAQVYALAEVSSADGRALVASGGADQTLRLWDVRSRTAVHTIPFGREIHALAQMPHTARIRTRTGNGAGLVVGALDGIYLLLIDRSLFP